MAKEAKEQLEREDNVPNVTDFIVEYVAEQFTDDSKTTDQIRRRLIKMGEVQKVRKAPRSKARIEQPNENFECRGHFLPLKSL